MTEPRWHDSDPRPPFGSVPGPDFRAARNRPDPTPRVYRRFGDGQPAAYDGPGWYREDPESAPPPPDSSPPARPGRPPPGQTQPGRSQPGRSQPSSSRPGPPGWTDPFSAVPMSSPGPDDGRRGGPADRGPGRRPAPGRGALAARQPDEEPGSRPARTWRWGRMSGIQGVGIVVIAAALGALVTVATKHDPGPLLGGFVVAGTLAAGFAVRPRAAYVLIPIPVLCYLIFGLAAGLGREELNSATSGLTVDAAQWIANGFLAMAAATVLAVLITLGRWLWARHTRPVGARPGGSRPGGAARGARLGGGGRAGRRAARRSFRSGPIRPGPTTAWTAARWTRAPAGPSRARATAEVTGTSVVSAAGTVRAERTVGGAAKTKDARTGARVARTRPSGAGAARAGARTTDSGTARLRTVAGGARGASPATRDRATGAGARRPGRRRSARAI